MADPPMNPRDGLFAELAIDVLQAARLVDMDDAMVLEELARMHTAFMETCVTRRARLTHVDPAPLIRGWLYVAHALTADGDPDELLLRMRDFIAIQTGREPRPPGYGD